MKPPPMWKVLLLAAAASALTACTEPESPKMPTAQQPTGGTSASSPSASPAAATSYDKARAFVRCMNINEDGTARLPRTRPPSPPVNGSGFSLNGPWLALKDPVEGEILFSSTADPNYPKCKHLLPETWPVKMDPADIARERLFGECLRKLGIYSPEPDAKGMVAYPADPNYQQAPEYVAAEKACAHLYDDPATRQGS